MRITERFRQWRFERKYDRAQRALMRERMRRLEQKAAERERLEQETA